MASKVTNDLVLRKVGILNLINLYPIESLRPFFPFVRQEGKHRPRAVDEISIIKGIALGEDAVIIR